MRHAIVLLVGLLATSASHALDLSAYRWENRLLLVFASTSQGAALRQSRLAIKDSAAELAERDMLVIGIAPGEEAELRQRLEIPDDRLAFVLVGKDGGNKATQLDRLDLPALLALVDTMPMRKLEMRKESRQ